MGYLAFLFFVVAVISYTGTISSLVHTGGRMEELGKRIAQVEADVVSKESRFYRVRQLFTQEELPLRKIPIAYVSVGKDTRFAFAQNDISISHDS